MKEYRGENMEEPIMEEHMEEKTYKVYDSMYNVVGLSSYEEVHKEGLLHQVVHFWLAEEEDGELWLYIQKRKDEDPVYHGVYDILTSGHIDPEETHEEAMLHQIKDQLGLSLKKEQLTHIGHIRQQIKKGEYYDNAYVQTYFYETKRPEKDFSGASRVLRVKFEDMKAFTTDPEAKLMVYTVTGNPVKETSHDQWWKREEEFNKIVAPYIEAHLQ